MRWILWLVRAGLIFSGCSKVVETDSETREQSGIEAEHARHLDVLLDFKKEYVEQVEGSIADQDYDSLQQFEKSMSMMKVARGPIEDESVVQARKALRRLVSQHPKLKKVGEDRRGVLDAKTVMLEGSLEIYESRPVGEQFYSTFIGDEG